MAKGTKQAQSKQNQNKGKGASGQMNRNAGAMMGQSALGQSGNGGSNSAIEMLKQDHRKVESLFEQFEQADDDQQKEQLAEQICAELIIHMRLEESLFYPACRRAGVEDDKMDESQVEHDGAKMLLNDLLEADSDTPFFEAKVSVLKEMIQHHVEEEEKPGDGVFAQAQEHDIDDAGLARQIMSRKQELQQRGMGRRPIRPVAIGMADDFRESMGGYEGRGRDERGRSMSDNDERGFGARLRYEEDEYDRGYERTGRRSGGYEGGSDQSRGDEGRYGGSREQQNYGRRYEEDDRRLRSPYDDQDEDRRYGRGQGGWFGDSRGHSEAARRGSDERRDDDDRGRRRSRDDDDDRRGSNEGGWFGDSRGHSEASRRGWQHRR
jgi:hemerythrin superfamily protein